MDCKLTDKKCTACRGDVDRLKGEELKSLQEQLPEGWDVVDEHHLTKTFTFKNFQQALDFTNRVGAVAEEEGHHPDISLSWGKVVVDVCTHKIDGLTENDFIFAAKADAVL